MGMTQIAPFVFTGNGWIKACRWSDGLPYAVGSAAQVNRIDRTVGYPVPVDDREGELLAVSLPVLE